MQHRIIYNRVLKILMFGLLMLAVTALYADSGYYYQQLPGYTPQSVVDHSDSGNPWALPEKSVQAEGFRKFPGYKNYQQNSRQVEERYQGKNHQKKRFQAGRFVTPEILEKLKQQQTRTQQMPDHDQYYSYLPRSPYTRFRQPLTQGTGSTLSCEVGNTSPLYDEASVSPWGGDPALRYRGGLYQDQYSNTAHETYSGNYPDPNPWAPKEAVGGIAPMNVPLLNNDLYSDGIESNYYKNKRFKQQNNAFKPFDFMP